MAGRGKSGSGESDPNRPTPEEFRSKEYPWSSSKNRTRDYRDGHEPERAHRARRDYGHESSSRNVSYHRSRRSTSKIKKKGGRGRSHAERSSTTDDSRNQERFGGRSRSVERGRRRHHQRESSRRRRIRHTSPHKRSSRDRSRKRERRAEHKSTNSIGFSSHREGSGNPHLRSDREESIAREGSVPEPVVGQGIQYSAAHDNGYEQEAYGAMGGYPYDQLFSYAAAGHYSTLHYSYGAGMPDLDHIRNGNTNASRDDTLREIGAQHTTTVACQTPSFLPFEYSSYYHPEQYTNSESNQIRSEFVSLGDNPYEIPNIHYTSSAVQGPGNASPVSATSAMSISSGRSPRSVFSNNGSDIGPRKGPICIKCQKPEFTPIDLIVSCIRCLGSYHASCHDPAISVTRGVT
ncbi:hypothetical protein HOY82DRAFT_71028 [Tuber indicum]|nr:hypothetical protein HOY82DRAFT_71028 [Tuber indicum]